MTFSTSPGGVRQAPLTTDPVKDAIAKLQHHPDYRMITNYLAVRGVKLLNDSLRDPGGTVSNSRVSAYAEIYHLLTGKDLFNAPS